MKILALDTTEDACSAALLLGEEVVEHYELAPRRHSEIVLPMMDRLLHDADVRLIDLDALAFTRGPGSFTGVRIATSIAQGTAFGAGLPVVPVSSLHALAVGCRRECGADAILVALDARMHEVYWSGFRADADGPLEPAVAEAVVRPDDVEMPTGGAWHGVGSGWAAHGDVLRARCPGVVEIHSDARVHAQDVARLGAELFAAGAHVSAVQALPVYLRDEVAWAKQ